MRDHQRFAGVRRYAGSCAFVVMLVAAGCRSAPDLTPFSDATSQLCASIKASGRVTSDELDAMARDWPRDQRAVAARVNEQFRTQWTDRDRLADALLTYSSSLTSIVAAGDSGASSVAELSASFKSLTEAVDVALPPGTVRVFESSVQLGAYLYGMWAKDEAAKTLGEGMKKMQPAIDETARVLGESLKQIETGLDAVRDQAAANVEDSFANAGGEVRVRQERDTLVKLFTRRRELAARLAQGGSDAALREDLETIDATIASQSAILAPFDAKKASDRARISDEIALVRAAREGLAEWAAAHGRLADAALTQRTPNVDVLVQTATDIRGMIRDIREARRE